MQLSHTLPLKLFSLSDSLSAQLASFQTRSVLLALTTSAITWSVITTCLLNMSFFFFFFSSSSSSGSLPLAESPPRPLSEWGRIIPWQRAMVQWRGDLGTSGSLSSQDSLICLCAPLLSHWRICLTQSRQRGRIKGVCVCVCVCVGGWLATALTDRTERLLSFLWQSRKETLQKKKKKTNLKNVTSWNFP